MTEKIQKVLARAGFGSRREIEKWIDAGRITVNRAKAKLGDRISVDDDVCIDKRPINLAKSQEQETRVLLYNKPEGEMCTRKDPEGRPTIFERLPRIRNGRWIAVGRLDLNTSGLLLLTNDGALANQLMHPASELEREYAVRIRGNIAPQVFDHLLKGVKLSDGLARFHSLQDAGGEGSNHWFHVVVKEGRNRLVRRLWESQGCTVSRLIRIRFGSIHLPANVRRGHYIELSSTDWEKLL